MAENNARIFQEMQAADTIRRTQTERQPGGADINVEARALQQQMWSNVLQNFRESNLGKDLGNIYDSEIAKGAVGGLRDAYRRCFENGWYGKDVFDGRFHMDNRVGETPDMGNQYDHRAGFYGWDNNKDNGVETAEKSMDYLNQERMNEQQQARDIGR